MEFFFPVIGHFEALGTGSLLYRIALWDCLKGRVFYGPSFRRNFVMVDERRNSISAPLRSTTWIENHYAHFGCFGRALSDITIRYTTTSITFKTVVDKPDQSWATVNKEYCQNGGWKKNPVGKKLGRIRGSCSEKPILRRLHGSKVFPAKHYELKRETRSVT